MEQEKRKVGRKAGVKIGTYANHKKPEDRAPRNPTLSIYAKQSELDRLREKARIQGKTISRFVIELAGCSDEQNSQDN